MKTYLKAKKWLWLAGLALALVLLVAMAGMGSGRLRAAGDNLVVNGGFENGVKNWKCKICKLTTGNPSETGAGGQLLTTKKTGRAQLLQNNIALQPNTRYQLSFWARSSKSEALRVTLLKGKKPGTNYGIKNANFKLTAEGQFFTLTFTTTGFKKPVNDAQLRFQAVKGKGINYSIDSITLVALDGPAPTATNAATATTEPQHTATPAPTDTAQPESTATPTATAEPGNTATPTATAVPENTATPRPSATPGSGGDMSDEILVFNRGSKGSPFVITQALSGFVEDKAKNVTGPANANWVTGQYAGFSKGTLYYRARIYNIPKNQLDMKFGFCFWENKFVNEQCRGQVLDGVAGTDVTWSHKLNDMWIKSPVNFANPRTKWGFIVRNQKNKPVSAKKGWKWNGENPTDWYPMQVHYTVVLVKEGGTFDGWENYGW